MKINWSKTVRSEDATKLHTRLLDTYGLEYTGGWYSTWCIRNGYMYHQFVVQAESDDLTMFELGFKTNSQL